MDPTLQKQHVRRSIAERLQRLSEKDRQAESRSICRRILEELPKEPLVICAFYPMKNEPDILPLLKELLKQGCDLYLPRTKGRAFTFRRVTSLAALVPGLFHFPEPPADAEPLILPDVRFVLVPGVAFDRTGNRLGRGNGGYDKWLRQLRSENDDAETWGVALECQLVYEVPAETHDERVDAIVTARGITRIR